MNLREPPLRSAKYLRGSKDESCKLRIPGVCTDEGVVPCHARDRHSGRGQKASDLSVIDGCGPCHDVFDLRTKLPSGQFLTSEEWLFYALRGLQDTLESRVRRKIIIVPLDAEHLSSTKPTPPRKPKADRTKIPARANAWPQGRKIPTRAKA
jgi:hypothetical protein